MPNLVLEKGSQRFQQLEVHAFRKAADVVVALDDRRVADAALDHVRVNGSLRQEVHLSDAFRFFLKTRMNSSPMISRLRSGSSTPASRLGSARGH